MTHGTSASPEKKRKKERFGHGGNTKKNEDKDESAGGRPFRGQGEKTVQERTGKILRVFNVKGGVIRG